uniref:C-type lectin domain-containing protein n=1 Tax=Panagrolaimus davidi TaxID=227884 RepID=A0A914QSL8_9BILA
MSDLWIGATTLLSNGNWNWTDGSDFGFKDWNKGEPQNTSNTNCAAMSLTDEYWTSQDCNKKKAFVCQLSSASFTTPQAYSPTPTYPISANCSNGWSYFAPTHSCYGVGVGALLTNWTAAETFCQNNGGHLPPIHSFVEFQHLLSYMYFAWYNLWTGIYSPDSGRTWKSTDGTPSDFLKYAPWCSGYPTNVSGERCVGLSADCCFDKDCTTYTMHTLCKKPLFV